MDRDRQSKPEAFSVGGWTKRQALAREVLLKLIEVGSQPKSTKREDIERWAENRAEIALTVADALFDFLERPEPSTPAPLRREVRDGAE